MALAARVPLLGEACRTGFRLRVSGCRQPVAHGEHAGTGFAVMSAAVTDHSRLRRSPGRLAAVRARTGFCGLFPESAGIWLNMKH